MGTWGDIIGLFRAEAVQNESGMTPEQARALENAVRQFAGTFHAMTIDATTAERVRGFVFFVENEGGRFRVQIQQETKF